MNVDEFGERLHIDTHHYARIVSKEGLLLEDDIEVEPEEEEIVDEEGNVIVSKKPVPVIPVPDLYNVSYFQFRIDEIKPPRVIKAVGGGATGEARAEIEETDEEQEPNLQPKIVIGVCRSTF